MQINIVENFYFCLVGAIFVNPIVKLVEKILDAKIEKDDDEDYK
jgi:hypothetical protein